jgi:tetratricopeptide (TPR) repeat protein
MQAVRRMLCVALAACVMCGAVARGQSAAIKDQIAQHEQKLAAAREAKKQSDEAYELLFLGVLHRQTGEVQLALQYYNQSLLLCRALGARLGEATTLNNIGQAYSDLGQKQNALDYFTQALPIWQELGNKNGEASTLNNMGATYGDLGQKQKALDYYNQALMIKRATGDRGGQATTLNNIGKIDSDLGRKQEALDNYNQVLTIERELGDHRSEATVLNNIGKVYDDLAQKQKAIELYTQALEIQRAAGDRYGAATTLNNLGGAYGALRQNQNAVEYFNLALPLLREMGNRRTEATMLSNIGTLYWTMGELQKSLEYFNQALPMRREMGDRGGEAYSLYHIGLVYFGLGQKQMALASELAALSLAKEVEDPNLQGGINTSLMQYFRGQQRPQEAIFFGTEAVNAYQQIRKDISGLDQELQTGFAQSKSATYRQLAELLVQADRLDEAEHVIDLLKEEELKEVVRGAASDAAAKVEPLKMNAAQQQAQSDLSAIEKSAADISALSMEYAVLLAKPARTTEEDARLKTLDASIEAGNNQVSDFFKKTIYTELAQKTNTVDANTLLRKEKSEVSSLQNTLAELGPRVMGIRLLLGDEHAYAILVTAQARRKFELKATPAELRSKVLQVRDDLRTPSSDPKQHLAELYAMVVAPYDDELKAMEDLPGAQGRVPVLLWSLDGVVRYLPMSALYDGKQYMVERFNNVLFTPESYGHMTAGARTAKLSVLAMGLSKSYGGLPALPGVMPELDAVVHDPAVPESHGPMEGRLLGNEQFTLAALKTELGAGKSFPVVHIASHFVVEAGSGEEPYLMLGGESSGDAAGICADAVEDGGLHHQLSWDAVADALRVQHGQGRRRQRRHGDGQPGNDCAAEGRRSGAGHAMGRERRQHQPADERLLRALGEQRSGGRQGGGAAPGATCVAAWSRRSVLHPMPEKRTWSSSSSRRRNRLRTCSRLRASVLLGAVCADGQLSVERS